MTTEALFLVSGAAVGVLGVVRVARDPRRISNGLILLCATVFLVLWAVIESYRRWPEVNLLSFGLFLVVLPLLLLAAALGLLVNGLVITRRAGLRIATVLLSPLCSPSWGTSTDLRSAGTKVSWLCAGRSG